MFFIKLFKQNNWPLKASFIFKIMKKLILIQIRKEKEIASQEKKIFCNFAKKAKVKFLVTNIFYNKIIVKDLINKYDLFVIGGSSCSITDKFPQKSKIKELLYAIEKNKKPFLGICFGFQLLVHMFGGKVVRDLKNKELGTKKISLTYEAKKEKIFSKMPKNFLVQEAHEWRVEKLPKKFLLLAIGNRVKIQGVKIKNSRIYGVQFHPELSVKDMKRRLEFYKIKNNFDNLEKSETAEKIVTNFFEFF